MGVADTGLAAGADVDGEERMKAELILLDGGGIGDETLVGGGTGGGPGDTGDADAKPEKSSDANRSLETAGTADFVVDADGWVNAKFNPFDGARAGPVGAFG